MKFSLSRTFAAIGITVAAVSSGAVSTPAANIVDEWASVKAPPPPELKPVTVDPNTTALLMLDFMNQNCGKRPRCVETIPAMKKLLDEARAAKAPVVYSIIANTTAGRHHGCCSDGRRTFRAFRTGQVHQHGSGEDPQG